MAYESEFNTLAEIGITLAGFTGVTVAFTSRAITKESRAQVVSILASGLAVVVFAFLPSVIDSFLVSTEYSWRTAQMLFGVYHIIAFALHRKIGGALAVNPLESYLLLPIAVIIAVFQIVTGLGFFSEYLISMYFLSLVWFTFAGTWNFGKLIVGNFLNDT